MTYNKFTINLVFRIILILTNLIGISYLYHRGDLLYSLIFLGFILVAQIVALVSFVNKTNSELSKFILALRDEDYTTKFPKAENESFAILYERFQNTLEFYKKKETKYEAQYLFIQELIDNIETGLLAFDENKKIVVINRVARQMRSDYQFEGGRSLISILEDLPDSQIITGESLTGEKVEFLVNRSEFKLLDQPKTIYTFKDISRPLESKEIQSWQKLIRILAHEIINSLTPITSLSETTLLILKNPNAEQRYDDIELSLKTIRERSENLLSFMEDYRKLIKVPPPKSQTFNVQESIKGILHLFQAQLEGIIVKQDFEFDEIYADPILFEQVMVNLFTNSMQALENRPARSITLTTNVSNDWFVIRVKDNGCGMDEDTLTKALIPFYTTKSSGSGIGLSLVQQIINLHRGKVQLESREDEFTQVSLLFPQPN